MLKVYEARGMILKLQRMVEDHYFANRDSLNKEQKTELNELYFTLQQAEKHLQNFERLMRQ